MLRILNYTEWLTDKSSMRSTHSAAPRLPGCHTLHKPWQRQRFTTKVEHVIILVKPKGSKKVTSRDDYPLPSSAALPPTFWRQASQGTTRPSPPAQEPHPPPLPCSQFGNGGVLSIGLPTLVFQRFCFGFKISRRLKDPPLTILLFSSDLWRVSRQNGHCHWFPPPWRATGGSNS